jgi:sulfur carrier protein
MKTSIMVNGSGMTLTHRLSIRGLIELLEIHEEDNIAVEINREIIPRSRYRHHILENNDQIEIVRAVGGG